MSRCRRLHPSRRRARARIRRRLGKSATASHRSLPAPRSMSPAPSPACARRRPVARPPRRVPRGLALVSKPCGTSPWKCSAKAIPFPTSAAWKPRPAKPPEPSRPDCQARARCRVAGRAGYSDAAHTGGMLAAVDAWRKARHVPMAVRPRAGRSRHRAVDALSAAHLVAASAPELAAVPRANINFLPIKDAWFSGSMNYMAAPARATARRNTKPPTRSTRRSRSRIPSSSSSSATRWCPDT
jgi:hypothetical protein